jgi:hypothetical protein
MKWIYPPQKKLRNPYADGTGGGGSGGGGINFGGRTLCIDSCAIGGKVFEFFAPQSGVPLIITPGLDISISSGTDAIQLHRWSQEPNLDLVGREFVGVVSQTGGTIAATINTTYRWISIFARNPSNGGEYDGVCFTVNGNVLTLVGFS